MPMRWPVIQLPAATPIIAFLVWAAYLIWEATRRHDWIGAALVSATAALVTYLLLRALRKPKGRRMALLSKEQIFSADDRKWEDVPVPEWNGTVRIMGLDGTQRDAYEASTQKLVNGKPVQDLRNFRARLVALCAIKEDGTLMFEQNEVAALARRSSAALSRLFDVACRLSGITDDDVEALTENFDSAPEGPSTSASPPTYASAPSPSYLHGSAPTS